MPVTAFQMPEVQLNVQVFHGAVTGDDLDVLVKFIAHPESRTFERDVLGFFAPGAVVEQLPLTVLSDYRRRIADLVERSGFRGRLRVAQVSDDPAVLAVLRFWETFSAADNCYRWTTRTFTTLGPACAWLHIPADQVSWVRAAVDRALAGGGRAPLSDAHVAALGPAQAVSPTGTPAPRADASRRPYARRR